VTSNVLWLENRALDEAVIVAPTGRLDALSYRQLRDHLIKVSTDSPRAIVVDLAELEVDPESTLAIFPAVHTRLEQWPGVPLLLVTGSGRIRNQLARNGTGRYLPVHDDLTSAIAAIDEPPPRRVAHVQLPNSLTSPRLAREFTRLTCAGWGLDRLLDDALLLVGELVTNAVMHTDSTPVVRLELRRTMFSVAVCDDLRGEVTMRDPGGDFAGIHGLLLVAQIAAAWGSSPTSTGGKVVWATLRPR
jgi:anti-anti-sigma regulatory factor